MGRKRKLPEDYAREHQGEFEVRVIWREEPGLMSDTGGTVSGSRVAENALMCRFCDTVVRPKGSRISEHLISARHKEMKKRALGEGEVTSSTAPLPITISPPANTTLTPIPPPPALPPSKDSFIKDVRIWGVVRTLTALGVTRSSAISSFLSFLESVVSSKTSDDTPSPQYLLQHTMEGVFTSYFNNELIPMLRNRKLNMLLDVKAEINGIPAVTLYTRFFNPTDNDYRQLLLDVKPLPVSNLDILSTYISGTIKKYKISPEFIATISVSGNVDVISLYQKLLPLFPFTVVFSTPSTELNDHAISNLSKFLPGVYSFVYLFPLTVASSRDLTRKYIQQRVCKDGIQATNPILPPQVTTGDLSSWVNTAESLVNNWDFVSKFCIDNLSLPEFSTLNRFLMDMGRLYRDLKGCIKILSPLSVFVRSLDEGFMADKVNAILTHTAIDLCNIEPLPRPIPIKSPFNPVPRGPKLSAFSVPTPGDGEPGPHPEPTTFPSPPSNPMTSPKTSPLPMTFTSPLLLPTPPPPLHSPKPTNDMVRFTVGLREALTRYKARSAHGGITGPGSFFERLGELCSSGTQELAHGSEPYAGIFRVFAEGPLESASEVLTSELDTYRRFIGNSHKVDINVQQYWLLVKSALPILADVALSGLAVFTGNNRRFTGRIIRDYEHGTDVNLCFDDLIRMCIMNYNLN